MAKRMETGDNVEQSGGVICVRRRPEQPQLDPRPFEKPVFGVVHEAAQRRFLIPAAEIERRLQVVADLPFDVPGEVAGNIAIGPLLHRQAGGKGGPGTAVVLLAVDAREGWIKVLVTVERPLSIFQENS